MRSSSGSFAGKWRISMTRAVCITIDNNKEELVHRKKQVRFIVKGTSVAVLEWQKNSHSQNHHGTLEYDKARNRTHTIERNIPIPTR